MLYIINPTKEAITVHLGMRVAKMEAVNDAMVAEVGAQCCPELSKSVSEKKKLL